MQHKSFITRIAGDTRGGAFFTSAATVFMVSFVSFYIAGIVPYLADGSAVPASSQVTVAAASQFPGAQHVALSDVPQLSEETTPQIPPHRPERIVIRSVGIDLPVLNPESTSISALDQALLSGTVRYPTSALAGQGGNVFIFGHTSHLPVVRNQMYRAFNELPNVSEGDTVKLVGGGYDYIYRVTEIRRTDANEELIDLSPTQGRKLTISTCDTFGAKSARWVVEAEFVGAYPSTGSTGSQQTSSL